MTSYLIFFALGFLPSFLWLLFYLKKDVHPESKQMILKIFLYGMFAAILAAIIEISIFLGISCLIENFSFLFFLSFQAITIILIAFTEEMVKYLVVKKKVINNVEFDEPVDTMIYMIVAALGFAGLENILVLFSEPFLFEKMVLITFFRFIGATFLHALCSATIGYFLALSIFQPKKQTKLIFTGITIASFLHGLFNFYIIKLEKNFAFSIIFLIIILISLALFVSYGFKRLKKMASVCQIK